MKTVKKRLEIAKPNYEKRNKKEKKEIKKKSANNSEKLWNMVENGNKQPPPPLTQSSEYSDGQKGYTRQCIELCAHLKSILPQNIFILKSGHIVHINS